MENVTALLLTAYERYDTVGMNEFIECFIDENFSRGNVDLSAYAEYLISNRYEPWEPMDLFDELCQGLTPYEIAKKAFYGNFNPSNDYFRYNGGENFESAERYVVEKEAASDRDFLKWYIEENELIDEEEAQAIIDEANALIRKGY